MKKEIHPDYKDVTASCVCGATFQISSANEDVRVDICSQCHPFFTGKQKIVDTEGRVERYKKRYESAKKVKSKK